MRRTHRAGPRRRVRRRGARGGGADGGAVRASARRGAAAVIGRGRGGEGTTIVGDGGLGATAWGSTAVRSSTTGGGGAIARGGAGGGGAATAAGGAGGGGWSTRTTGTAPAGGPLPRVHRPPVGEPPPVGSVATNPLTCSHRTGASSCEGSDWSRSQASASGVAPASVGSGSTKGGSLTAPPMVRATAGSVRACVPAHCAVRARKNPRGQVVGSTAMARTRATSSGPALAGEPASKGGCGSYSMPSWMARA